MIVAMHSIFDSLCQEEQLSSDGYYITGDKDDCNFLQHSICIEKNIYDYLPYLILILKYHTMQYLFVLSSVSFGPEIEATDNLIEIELTPGMIASFLSEVKPKPLSSVTENKLRNQVFYPINENTNYKGHNADYILSLFGSIKAFQIKDTLTPSISFCLLDFLTQRPNNERALHLESHLSLIKDCLVFSNKEIIEQLCNIMWIKEYEIAFVKLYQLIELLYPIPYINNVHSIIAPSSHSVLDLLNIFTDKLDWKYIEITALEKLLNEISLHDLPALNGFDDISNSENAFLKIAKIIYNIRCRIVHKRFKQKKIRYDIEKWQQLYDVLLKIIKILYTKYSDVIEDA